MNAFIEINGRRIGAGAPVYVVAEMSANHGRKLERAIETVHAIKRSGADAVKVQTYTPDTLTISSKAEFFRIQGGTLWDGRTLYDLYAEAYMPWEWQPQLKHLAGELGLDFFSTPFDHSAVDFLESIGAPAYKVASFELVDLPLLRRVAQTRRPIILSTGMASIEEIEEAMRTIREAGGQEVALLKCTSAYPAPAQQMNLRTIMDLATRFGVPAGLSDHTMGSTAAVTAVALGACIVEKHFTLSRSIPGPDAPFSMEPQEFAIMVEQIRIAEQALGAISYQVAESENRNRQFRRSLFVVKDVIAGDLFDESNVRSIRPGHGMHTRHLAEILGRRAVVDIPRGTPLSWELVQR
jgi:N-acetylneuraminate synthase